MAVTLLFISTQIATVYWHD